MRKKSLMVLVQDHSIIFEEILNLADKALLKSKELGKNRITILI
jgi:PleD family two-component response regulator